MKKLLLICVLTYSLAQIITAQEYGWESLENVLHYTYYSDVFAIDDEVWICSGSSTELY